MLSSLSSHDSVTHADFTHQSTKHALILQTVADLADGGCFVVVPLVLLSGLAVTSLALWIWWQSATNGYQAINDTQVPHEI